jgi:hypothetical protein
VVGILWNQDFPADYFVGENVITIYLTQKSNCNLNTKNLKSPQKSPERSE